MLTFYQRRGTGKSTNLVGMSYESGLPIACVSQSQADHLQWIADEILKIEIPKPFIATKEACTKTGEYLMDEAGIILEKLLGGKIVAMTINDDGDKEYADYVNKYVYKSQVL